MEIMYIKKELTVGNKLVINFMPTKFMLPDNSKKESVRKLKFYYEDYFLFDFLFELEYVKKEG